MEELPSNNAMISTKAVATGDKPWPNGPSQSGGRVSVVNSFCAVVLRLHAVPYAEGAISICRTERGAIYAPVQATWLPSLGSVIWRLPAMSALNMHCSHAPTAFRVLSSQKQASSVQAWKSVRNLS